MILDITLTVFNSVKLIKEVNGWLAFLSSKNAREKNAPDQFY